MDFFATKDFATLEKIDAHLHFNYDHPQIIALAQKYNFKLVTVNVEFDAFGTIDEQFALSRYLLGKYPDTVRFIASFSTKGITEDNWLAKTIATIEEALAMGAVGIKVWKNIGMELKDERNRLLSICDAKFDELFFYLAERSIPVMIHQGEPKNCWLPLEKMTMKYDRAYFEAHPRYHMFLHPEMPSYEALLKARDGRLAKHPDLISVNAHLASLEWNVDLMAAFLDRFPGAFMDTAARSNHLMYQAKSDRDKVRAFFLAYQDRILYGTDFFVTAKNVATAVNELERLWLDDWRFFSSAETLTSSEFDGSFQGLDLPLSVLEKIYRGNALRALSALGEQRVLMAENIQVLD